MQLADRRYLQLTTVAWVVICSLTLAWVLPAERQRGVPVITLTVGGVLMAFAAAIITAIVVAIPLRVIMNLMLKDRRRSHRTETIVLAGLLIVVVAYLFDVRRERLKLSRPPGVATLSAFADAMPAPRRLELVGNKGRDYIAWTGNLSGPCDLPSGPARYIFDNDGDLIDWQPETGDGGPVEDFLRSSVKQRQLTVDEALKITDHDRLQ